MQIDYLPTADIYPYAGNPRQIGSDAVDVVAASIKEFGWRQPIAVDEDMIILVGHTRLLAAKSLGMETVPVHVATGLTNAQKKAYRIADNKTGEFSQWDNDLLAVELEDLRMADFDLGVLAFDDGEIDKILGGMEDATPQTSTKEIDPDSYQMGCRCPKCGFEFDDKT